MSTRDPGEDNRPTDTIEATIKREMNHIAEVAHDEMNKLSQKLINQMIRVQALEQQLAAERERADEAEKLLHDLTPMGSDFWGSPQKCHDWVEKHMSNLMQMLVDSQAQLNAERERVKALEEAVTVSYTACQVLKDTYPSIAGRVIALEQAGEVQAHAVWAQIARRQYAVAEKLSKVLTALVEGGQAK